MARKKAARSKIDQAPNESPELGLTSQEEIAETSPAAVDNQVDSGKKNLLSEFSIYDALLLTALACVTLATMRVFFAMTQYGGYFWSKPWNP